MPGALASHIVGGDIRYRYVNTIAGGNNYEITLVIYEDNINGTPIAIGGDNPAIIAVYDGATNAQLRKDNVFYIESSDVPANFSSECVTNYPRVGTTKKVFVINYVLPPSNAGYTISWQKCCKNENIANIFDPGGEGSTFSCFIPPIELVARNTCAVFKNYPPLIICNLEPLSYDHSATDADGDSLSYEFCNALIVHGDQYPYPEPAAPPYDSVSWFRPVYNFNSPITGSPSIVVDPVTGMITGSPNRLGRYLVVVCCHEWRKGVLINSVRREFQFVITDCSRKVVADMPQFSDEPNTYILNCEDYDVHFLNTSKGGTSWHWDFGDGALMRNTSGEFDPVYTYPDTGIYVVKLIVNPGGICQDSISKLVKIFPRFHAAFTDTGNFCPDLPINFIDRTEASVKPITSWQWNFGDNTFSPEQNPVHVFPYGGTYNVVLVAQNIRGCRDTALSRVIVENFRPFAGNDTFIVKGEEIIFNAQGGVAYSWSPEFQLTGGNTSTPRGYYPDTGLFHYDVTVESAYGCSGMAGIDVHVVEHASFFVPNAFSPNGDGLNDVFRAKAVGYRSLKYFRVFNRFGEPVYYGSDLETGWDGTYNHLQADIGVYFWQIEYVDRTGKEGFVKGDVTLLR